MVPVFVLALVSAFSVRIEVQATVESFAPIFVVRPLTLLNLARAPAGPLRRMAGEWLTAAVVPHRLWRPCNGLDSCKFSCVCRFR